MLQFIILPNLDLTIQHGRAGSLPNSPRTARVSFTTSFNRMEVLAGAVFKAELKILSNDNYRNQLIGTTCIKATSADLARILTRHDFDEDIDIFR